LIEDDVLEVVTALNGSSIDLIDISGGTYFPGAKAASDGAGRGPYFTEFAKRACTVTTKPLMQTGGFKTRTQAEEALASGAVDVVGLARALVLEPSLPDLWKKDQRPEPVFPRFSETPEGGITAWYTMRITEIGADKETQDFPDLGQAIQEYEARDKARTEIWLNHFANDVVRQAQRGLSIYLGHVASWLFAAAAAAAIFFPHSPLEQSYRDAQSVL